MDDPSTTIPGGRYVSTSGFWVNAEGHYIDAKGNEVSEPVKANVATNAPAGTPDPALSGVYTVDKKLADKKAP